MDVIDALPSRLRVLLIENDTLERPLEPILRISFYTQGDAGEEPGSDQEQGHEYLGQPTGLFGGEDD